MGVKFGTEEGTSHPPRQISRPSVQRVAAAGRKTSKSASDLIKYRRVALLAMLPGTITDSDKNRTLRSSLRAVNSEIPVLRQNVFISSFIKTLYSNGDRHAEKVQKQRTQPRVNRNC